MPNLAPLDTLVCDTAQIAAFRNDGAYDYGRELVAEQDTLMDWLGHWLAGMLTSVLGPTAGVLMSRPVLLILGVAVVAVIVWFVYRNRPELFSFVGKRRPLEYELEEETIYGIDFEAEIHQALQQRDYRQAVRFAYLQTLRRLSDGGRIDWQPYKTPAQYAREERSAAFRRLTNLFLRVRYGNFEATEAVWLEVERLAEEIAKLSEHSEVSGHSEFSELSKASDLSRPSEIGKGGES